MPMRFERKLEAAIKPMIRQIRATLTKLRTAEDAAALGRALARDWSDARIDRLVREIGESAEKYSSSPWAGLVKKIRTKRDALGDDYDGAALIERWSIEAAAKIKSVRDEVAEALRRDIVEALAKGTPPEVLAARWRREGIPVTFGTLEGRTKVIAQSQLHNLHAQVQSARARAVGATRFVWRTQLDAAVRAEHQALEGTVHEYDDPPSEGLPGTPVNCRCWAETVIDDDLLARFGPRTSFGVER